MPETVTSPMIKSGTEEEMRSLEAGLDSLQSEAVEGRGIDWSRVLLPLAAFIVVLLAWQFYVSLGLRRRDLVPGPLDVLGSLGALWGEGTAQEAVWTSLQRGIMGFAISIVVATPIGLLLSQVRVLRRAFGPLISGLQVLPSVAWVPAAIIWFGLTDATVYFVMFMGAIPSIINGLIAGVDQIPPAVPPHGPDPWCFAVGDGRQRGSPRRIARLCWWAQAGMGVLMAFADGCRDHCHGRFARLRAGFAARTGPPALRHGDCHVSHLDHFVRGHLGGTGGVCPRGEAPAARSRLVGRQHPLTADAESAEARQIGDGVPQQL